MALLWGGTHVQVAPHAALQRPRTVSERIQDRDAQGRVVMREVTKQMLDGITLPLDRSRVR